MKNKWILISAIIQLIFGIAAIISFIVLVADRVIVGENITQWILSLILAIGFVVSGTFGLIIYKSNKFQFSGTKDYFNSL